MSDQVFAAIDIGSSTIKVAVAERLSSEGDSGRSASLHLLGAIQHPTEGMTRGMVTNVDDVVASLTNTLEKAERLIGVPLTRACVSIGSPQLYVQPSRGVVAVSKVNGEVREEDVDRVVDAAQTITTPPNYEILHVLPRFFTVDGQQGIVDPVGMVGTRLEVDAQIIYAPTSHVRNLTKSIYRAGCEIDDVIFGVLASAESMLDKRQREVGVVLVNIGFQTTSVVVFEEGNVIHAAVLGIGSNHITGDIAIGLRTTLDIAERIKCSLGSAMSERWNKREEVRWEDVGAEAADGTFSKRTVSEMIEARTEELLEMVDKELKKVDRSGMLPAGAVLTGGGALLGDLLPVAKRVLRLPVALGELVSGLIDGTEDLVVPFYSQALGILVWTAAHQSSDKPFMGGVSGWWGALGQSGKSLFRKAQSLFPWGTNRAMVTAIARQ